MFSQHILDRFRRLGADDHEVQQVETMLCLMDGDATTVLPPEPGLSVDPLTLSPPTSTVGFDSVAEGWAGETIATMAEPPLPGDASTAAPHVSAAQSLPSSGPGQAQPGAHQRYQDLCLLGRGGMGEVRRVVDRALGRTLAMKIAAPPGDVAPVLTGSLPGGGADHRPAPAPGHHPGP